MKPRTVETILLAVPFIVTLAIVLIFGAMAVQP